MKASRCKEAGRYYELTLFVDKAYFACIRDGIVRLSCASVDSGKALAKIIDS